MILCIDCGLTNGKLLLFSPEGVCQGEASFPTPLDREVLDTFALRERLYEALASLTRQADCDPAAITCVTVSGHGNGLYAIGAEDVLPVGYSSMMTPPGEFLPEPGRTFPMIFQSDWAGQPLPILAWLKHTQPEVYHSMKTVLFCKDLLRWFLTGSAVTEETDASAAGLLNGHTGSYDPNLLAVYGLEDAMDKLPPVIKSSQPGGYVTPAVAARTGLPAGIPVLGGLFDVNSCMVGAGVIDEGLYSLTAGTWGINAAASRTLVETNAITQCCRFFGAADYVCIDSAPTSCTNLEWFVQNVLQNAPYRQVNEMVQQAAQDPGLLYLPYLYAPMDLPHAQGGFRGLKPHHTLADMTRAVYEGIVFEHRSRLEKLQGIGIKANAAVLSGGATNSVVFAQMFADVCGVEFRIPAQSQAGALGGAILGLTATGVYPDLTAAVQALVRTKAVFRPDPGTKDYYDRKFRLFMESRGK